MSGDGAAFWASLGAGQAALYLAPFGLLLACIAVLPLLPGLDHWWENNANKAILAAVAALAGVTLYVLPTGDWHRVGHVYLEYLAFLALLGSLFVISGGIHISGAFAGFPYVNTGFLALGAVLANLLGTTGASMLLIRPLLRANRARQHKSHIVVFFIFIVGNCGGLLTALGDPPLYLGFLNGVPFGWNLGSFKAWAFINFSLLFIFHLLDERLFLKEDLGLKEDLVAEVKAAEKSIVVRGWGNVLLLPLVMALVVLSSYWKAEGALIFQCLSLSALAAISWRLTPASIHDDNRFNLHPMGEVTALFFGIFGSMLPALAVLEANVGAIPLQRPLHYFWITGLLSGFLDNAPTYLTFTGIAAVKAGLQTNDLGGLVRLAPDYLAAVSYGAVFMGAMTYVGNGPNLMVKTIAQNSRVKMPGFGAYLLWSFGIIFPLMLVFSWIFLN